jgi:hypothetical protein
MVDGQKDRFVKDEKGKPYGSNLLHWKSEREFFFGKMLNYEDQVCI